MGVGCAWAWMRPVVLGAWVRIRPPPPCPLPSSGTEGVKAPRRQPPPPFIHKAAWEGREGATANGGRGAGPSGYYRPLPPPTS